ncbi:MAG: tRNA methyl transferase PRC-barrel domain-containing protein, partial [Candidatus Omnitrophota bacterium]
MKRIAVAMSGGVDSSFSALLLQQKGYEVFGLTMDFGLPGSKAVKDALGVAKQLRIKHYVINLKSLLEEKVIRDFCREYLSGRTPNPCVICNRYIKFGALFKKAFSLGADYLATGHYARIGEVHSPCLSGRQARLAVHRYQLKKAKDSKKDQSYFLYRLKQEHLKKINFPLGGYTKQEVRVLARKFNLPVADKSDSQEICFLQGADYRGFLKHRLTQIESFRTKVLGFIPSRKSTIPLIPRAKARGFLRGIKTRINANIRPGLIVDANGKVLGEHKGVAFYTIGQRQGLGIACGYPAFI